MSASSEARLSSLDLSFPFDLLLDILTNNVVLVTITNKAKLFVTDPFWIGFSGCVITSTREGSEKVAFQAFSDINSRTQAQQFLSYCRNETTDPFLCFSTGVDWRNGS